jgi:hypothetical protein
VCRATDAHDGVVIVGIKEALEPISCRKGVVIKKRDDGR